MASPGDRPRSARLILASVLLVYAAVYLAKVVELSVPVGSERYFVLSDDALISMRYAENLAQGHGLVWNAGEEAVEGYTNFLWVLWMALLHLLPLPKSLLPGALQLSILALNLWTLWLLRDLARELFAEARLGGSGGLVAQAAVLPVLLLAAASNFMGWSLSGFEVGLLTLATVGTLTSCYRVVVRGQQRYALSLAIWPTLGLLTRDDFVVIIAAIGAGYVAGQLVEHGPRSAAQSAAATLQRHAALLLLPAVAKSGHLLFRFLYYGDLLPNTYYAKVTNWELTAKLHAGGLYVLREAYDSKALLAVVALGIAAVAMMPATRISATQRRAALGAMAFLLVVLAVNAAYVLSVGGDAFPQGRFAVPLYPALFLAVALAGVLLVESLGRRRVRPVVALLAALVVAGTPIYREWRHGLRGIYVHDSWDAQWNIEYALFLRDLDPQARVAVFWAGGVPYWSELPAVDLLGLNDAAVARGQYRGSRRTPGHAKYDFEHSLGRYRPDFIVGFDVPEQLDPRSAAGAERLEELERTSRYPFVPALFTSPTFLAHYYDHVVTVPESIHVPGIRVFASAPGSGESSSRHRNSAIAVPATR